MDPKTKPKDKLDCPKCYTRMESKGTVSENSEDSAWDDVLYQCPKCKNVEIL